MAEDRYPTTRESISRTEPGSSHVGEALAVESCDASLKARESEETIRSIFDQGHFGVALSNLEGKFLMANPALARLLGYEPEELLGRHYTEVTHPEDCQASLDRRKQLLEGKTDRLVIETRFLRKSGETVWCSVMVSLIRDAAGQPAYTLALIQDLSELKKAEEARARLQEQLFQAQKMKTIGALAGGIAHDLNNLLGVILGFASLLRLRLRRADPLQETIRMIEQSAERASDLTRQLLGLSQPSKSESKPVRVSEVLERVFKIVTRTFDRRIRVQTSRARSLPWVAADRGQLEQAILNLCINARDAMPHGGTLAVETFVVTLGAEDPELPAQCPPGDYVRIVVKDTGEGIEPEVLKRIFDPFFTTKKPGKGTGLGLAVVQGIVHKARGFLSLESVIGRGSKFIIHLPVVQRRAGSAARKKPAHLERGRGTVLVVDDEPMMLRFAEKALKKLGYRVLTAENGKRACEVFAPRVKEINCVLLDVVMPEMGGLEASRKMREINPGVRILLTSGYGSGGEVRQALESAKVQFIGKPYTLETLSVALKAARPF